MPAKPFPTISESEWIVASIVWNHDGLTSTEISAQLPAERLWKLKTVNTFLARLLAKGVLRQQRDGRAFRYFAEIRREQCVQAESQSFLQRVFSGATAPMLAHFCETTELSDEEIAELRRILNQKAKSVRKSSSPRP